MKKWSFKNSKYSRTQTKGILGKAGTYLGEKPDNHMYLIYTNIQNNIPNLAWSSALTVSITNGCLNPCNKS